VTAEMRLPAHESREERAGNLISAFAEKYGPWALVAGASDGVGAAFAEALAERGVNVVLLARRQALLDEVAAGITERTGAQTRTIAIDLAQSRATGAIAEATNDLEVGMLVYCADFRPFLTNPIDAAETMVQRNCVVPMQLCHHFAPGMVERGRGGIVIFGSGAGLAGGPNMVAYGATKAFDMVFAEALWSELRDKGVDVVGLLLGKTNTPALRRLEYERGLLDSPDTAPPDADSVETVISEAFDNLSNGPTIFVGEMMRAAGQILGTLSRNDAVKLMIEAGAAAMGSDRQGT
jgi:short-subunit dehydrogenase